MNVKEIVTEWLKEHGYDGLCFPEGECDCDLEHLMRCHDYSNECLAGHNDQEEAKIKNLPYFIIPKEAGE